MERILSNWGTLVVLGAPPIYAYLIAGGIIPALTDNYWAVNVGDIAVGVVVCVIWSLLFKKLFPGLSSNLFGEDE